MSIERLRTSYGVSRPTADEGLVGSGNVVFGVEPTNDDFTVEKITSTIELKTADFHPDDLYLLAIERKPATTTTYPGDLTIYTYNHIMIDGSTTRRVLHTTHISSSTTTRRDRDYLIQGLGIGEGQCSFGFVFGADTASTQTVYYKLYRI